MKRSRFSEEQIPSSSCRWTKRIPELGLTAKRVAAWRRDMPDKTIFTIRIRKSCEIVMLNPPSGESNHKYSKSQRKKGQIRFNHPRKCSSGSHHLNSFCRQICSENNWSIIRNFMSYTVGIRQQHTLTFLITEMEIHLRFP